MKRFYIYLSMLAAVAGYGQEKEIPSQLSLAVKESPGWRRPYTPDFTYYSKNHDGVFRQSHYTADILDRRLNMVYVDTDRLYSNTYVPVTLQQSHSNLAVDNFYRYEKMYALPDAPVNQPPKR